MTPVILAVDQGSSSSRCLVLSASEQGGHVGRPPGLAVLGTASSDVATALPRPGWVEHDPDEITLSVRQSITAALTAADASWRDVCAIGLAAQTETFIVWERGTGRPVYPAISWRDSRAADVCRRLSARGDAAEIRRRSGLPLQSAFSAPKLRWLLDEIDGGQRRAAAGELLFGDVNTWLTWQLSGGTAHVAEPSMASRTMLFSLADLTWDPVLLELFGIPAPMLPDVYPTAGRLAMTDAGATGGVAPICATVGDQQAALFGQRCFDAGQAKLTLGTGAFLWCQAGADHPAVSPDGVVASCAWQIGEKACYGLEGFVPNAGSVVPWLRRLGVLPEGAWPSVGETALVRAAQAGTGGVWCVPAVYGLGTPAWSGPARADIVGLTATSTAADVAEAALLGVAHQVADAIDAVGAALPEPPATIRVDGGMARNDSLLQAIADLGGAALERPSFAEATALGAGALAGLGAGAWDAAAVSDLLNRAAGDSARIRPGLSASDRASVRQSWRHVREQAVSGWLAPTRQR
ncbi:MAG TPA: FGGY family carbohydrate kinase [Streptosporangiaceae bacterium]|nr:FGGY family carbohydrate kinase [Streptosporangiaceae bacterium]